MIAVDTSAILAILLLEPEEAAFQQVLTASVAVIGAPTLVEVRLVLEGHYRNHAEAVLRGFIARNGLKIVPFDAATFEAAISAFARFGRGRGHPAKLNFGDCMAYGVAKTHNVPLLFKGRDFIHTDLVPAYVPSP